MKGINTDWYRWLDDILRLQVVLQPQAKKNALVSVYHGRLKIQLMAKPQDGEANKQLIKFLAKEFDVTQKQIEIVQGLHQRQKLVDIHNPSKAKVQSVCQLLGLA
ncbi:MAG: YggU family protein [Proteobacteria bacterium]|nr:YggU family protein [Pseudomonadota bacterium]